MSDSAPHPVLCARVGWPKGARNKIGAAIIKLAQPSRYYHTVLRMPGGVTHEANLLSGVQDANVDVAGPEWVRVTCPWADVAFAQEYFDARRGHKYDALGLIDWGIRRVTLTLFGRQWRTGIENHRTEFCSELNAGQLGFDDPTRYSPSALVRACKARSVEFDREQARPL